MSGWRVHYVPQPWMADKPSGIHYWEKRAADCEAQSASCGNVCFHNPGTGDGTGSNRPALVTCKRCLTKMSRSQTP